MADIIDRAFARCEKILDEIDALDAFVETAHDILLQEARERLQAAKAAHARARFRKHRLSLVM